MTVETAHYDLVIIGGGINGAGIARDATRRGLRVFLCERDDFAAHTSSWSTKLIHGGLRYLEYYEFRLVREALTEREVLLRLAPHLIRPMRFILPHHKGLRPAWLLRIGLFLYDNLGVRKTLEGTKTLKFEDSKYGDCLDNSFIKGFEYSDCQVDDSRLVIANIIDAHRQGAHIAKGIEFKSAHRENGVWNVGLEDSWGLSSEVTAKALVNAAGPWVNIAMEGLAGIAPRKKLRLVKGSHIITKRLYDHDRAYIFQNSDDRIIFAIPYVNNTTLIGTTDIAYDGEPANAAITQDEIDYLCESISDYMKTPVTPQDVLYTYSGVRPLYDELDKKDASAVTRDYAFDLSSADNLPLLSVYGGKLTTYRKLAEHALDSLSAWFPLIGPCTSHSTPLPGGDTGGVDWAVWTAKQLEIYANFPEAFIKRLINVYGTDIAKLLDGADSFADLGEDFGGGLTKIELDYLIVNEWVNSADDALMRRTKLGQILTKVQITRIASYIEAKVKTTTI